MFNVHLYFSLKKFGQKGAHYTQQNTGLYPEYRISKFAFFMNYFLFLKLKKRFYLFIFREGGGRKKEKEININ